MKPATPAGDPAGRLAGRVILFIAWSWTAQWLIAGFEAAFRTRHDILLPGSIFCDTIESALAIRSISTPLLTDPRVLHWPFVFRHFLYQNDYLSGNLTIYHVLPLAMLHLMAMAAVIVRSSPWLALAVSFLVYLVGAIGLQKFVDGLHPRERDGHLAWILCLLSYPAVFMLQRANYAAGYANLGFVLYLLTAVSGKGRFLGFLALAFALNIRPNAVLVALVEFALVARVWPAIRAGVTIGVMAALIGVGSALVAHSIDPKVSAEGFLRGYGLYQAFYVFGDWGMFWNESLFGAERIIAAMFGHRPSYDPHAAHVVAGLCLIGLAGIGWLIWTRRATPVEASFLAVVACVLMTPVYYEYHGLIMIAPLLVVCEDIRARGLAAPLGRAWPLLAGLIAGCLGLSLYPSGAAALALFVLALLAPPLVDRACRGIPGASSTHGVMLVISVLSLCAMGGQWTNGLAVAGLLLSAALVVGAACWRRPAGVTLVDRFAPGWTSDAPVAA